MVTSGSSEPPDYCQASHIPALCLTVPSCTLDDFLPLKSALKFLHKSSYPLRLISCLVACIALYQQALSELELESLVVMCGFRCSHKCLWQALRRGCTAVCLRAVPDLPNFLTGC